MAVPILLAPRRMLCRIVEGDDMSLWNPGDRAILADLGSRPLDNGTSFPQFWEGAECSLLEYMGDRKYHDGVMKDAWRVQADRILFVAEPCLRKPYDGHEPCTWEDMKDIFQPKELVVYEN